MHADVLILGQGLAGSTLAWRLAEHGLSVVVVDRGGVDESGRPSASRVAAGLITPVTGKRLAVADGYEEQWAIAQAFYRGVEETTGRSVMHEQPALRVFRDPEEHHRFLTRGGGNHAVVATPSEAEAGIPMPCGAMVMPGAARLDTQAYLGATAQWLGERLVRGVFDPNRDVQFTAARVAIKRLGLAADRLILCQGHTPAPVRWLDGVRFSPAKGEVLTIDAPNLTTDRVIHAQGIWIAPCESGTSGRYRVGSTTEWHLIGAGPTEAGREELVAKLRAAGVTGFRVVDHQAAVRPATPDRRPVFGFSEHEPRVGWFNGLGAKGSLWVPTYAERMAELIVARMGTH